MDMGKFSHTFTVLRYVELLFKKQYKHELEYFSAQYKQEEAKFCHRNHIVLNGFLI